MMHFFKQRPLFVLLLCLPLFLVLGGCGKKRTFDYRIAIDASWYPVDFVGKEINVTLFSDELLQEIAILEKIKIEKVAANWDALFDGLYEKKYDGVLASTRPFLFNQNRYDFSDLYLLIGPVLIVSGNSKIDSLAACKDKEIAVAPNSPGALLIEKYPGVIIRNYTSIPEGLQSIVNQNIDGALIPVVPALSYINDLYHAQLKIATAPLTDEGLRLITLHGKNEKLIKLFDSGLKKLKKSGKYAEIAKKWNLSND